MILNKVNLALGISLYLCIEAALIAATAVKGADKVKDDLPVSSPKVSKSKSEVQLEQVPKDSATKKNNLNAGELLKESDKYRGASVFGISWNVAVETMEDGEKSSRSYSVKAKDQNALAECTLPARLKGEVFLFKERVMWFIKPGVRKPLAISSRQRVSGQAATGDIASTNYSRDYKAKFIRTEKIDDEEAHLLSLKAIAKNVTYDGINYWVSVKRKVALKAEFLTVSGEVFKVATFVYKNQLATAKGKIPFVSTMQIEDAQNPGNITTLTYDSPEEDDLDNSIFNINNIIR
jgi:hypothetical protein